MSNKYEKVLQLHIILKTLLFQLLWLLDVFSISAFASLLGIPIGITSSERGLNICAITAGIKKYKSIIKKLKKKHDKIVLLAKSKLNIILIFKA